MATYTTQVRTICEQYAGYPESVGYYDIFNAIDNARQEIFTVDYPMYIGGSKRDLENKILRHYYMREIGLETVGLWKHFLNTRMLEIMPYYCDYVKNSLNSFVPESTIDLSHIVKNVLTGKVTLDGLNVARDAGYDNHTDENTKDITTTTTEEPDEWQTVTETEYGHHTTTTGNVKHDNDLTRTPTLTKRDKYSDTPQNGITQVDQDAFLTNYRNITETGTETNTGYTQDTYNNLKDTEGGRDTQTQTQSGTNVITSREAGYDNHDYESQHDITVNTKTDNTTDTLNVTNITDKTTGITSMKEFVEIKARIRELVMNVDMMIISDLSDLFMRIY